MSNVLTIDNFERFPGLPDNVTWLRAVYPFFNQFTAQSYAAQTTVNDKSALLLTGRSTAAANWALGVPLPNEMDTYTLGMRILGTPAASQGSASIGIVANPGPTGYDVVLAIELTPNGATIHYKDEGGAKTQPVEFAYTNNDTYIDWTFAKISNTANEMSRFTMMVNNFPAFIGDVFNNAGENLMLAFAGVLSTVPDESVGYLRHHTISDSSPTNLGYAITDMYISRGGKRFGNPIVDSVALSSVTSDLETNDPDKTVQEVFEDGPQDWTFAQGNGVTTVTFNPALGEASQVRVISQTQQDGEVVPVLLEYGSDSDGSTSYWVPSTTYIVTEGSPNQAVLEIGNE